MSKVAKRFMSVLLAATVVISLIPAAAFADEQAQTSSDSAMVPTQADAKENSWRYTDGVLTADDEPTSGISPLASDYSGLPAWSKIPDGQGYVNSFGTPVPRAYKRGIDVSEYQFTIDWEAVKASGEIDYAIIRCGYGSDFADQDDKYWLRNVSECERLGIPYGVYLYSYAENVEMASSEADHVLRLLRGHHPAYPVYYDLEESKFANAESRPLLAAMATTFANKVEAAGYTVGMYANTNWWNSYLTDPVFDRWTRWVAQYNYQCTYGGTYDMWQYSSSGAVAGIEGRVDMNFELAPYPADVVPNDWYVTSGDYDYVWRYGIIKGDGGTGLFMPYNNITRGQVATILWRMAGEPIVSATPFEDVNYNEYYGPAINWARAAGVINGYKDLDGQYRTFAPDGMVTRQELVTMMASYASRIGGVNTTSDCRALDAKVDSAAVSDWARQSFGWAVDAGLISGVEEGGVQYLNPHHYAWRASMAAMSTKLDRDIVG